MFAAEAQRLAWVNGTILGRAVVPEVWSSNATFSGGANPVEEVGLPRVAANRNIPAASFSNGVNSMMEMPRDCAAVIAGESVPARTISA